MNSSWTSVIEQLFPWLDGLAVADAGRQIGALLGAILLAIGVFALAKRLLAGPQEALNADLAPVLAAGKQSFLRWLGAIGRPWIAWLLGLLLIEFFEGAGWEARLLRWGVQFLALWALYTLASSLLRARLNREQAAVLIRQGLLPLLIALVFLQLFSLIDDLLRLGFQVGDHRITMAAVLAGLAIVALFYAISRGSRNLLGEHFLLPAGFDPTLTQVVVSLVAYAIIIVGFLAALGVLGIPLTTFTVIAGGLSIGLGFGLQELISNFVSGFILLFERSIGPGDVVEVSETMGVVTAVGVRSMRVTNLDNVELIVPNNRFMTEIVTNYTRSDKKVRIHIGVGVGYDSKPREVEQALLSAAEHALVLEKPAPAVLFTGFGDNSLDFELLVWTEEPVKIPVLASDLRFQIWDALEAREIEIPFPQRDIHIRSFSPETASLIVTE